MSKLVVSGCSHTEGSAFWNNPSLNDVSTFSSLELQKFYQQVNVSKQWVRDNLTWGAKLKQIGKYKSFLNLARGGQGIDYILRKILFYIKDKDNLSDHTFIIQVPAPERKEILWKDILYTFSNLTSHEFLSNEHKRFLLDCYNPEYYEYYTLQTLFNIQLLLESRNAKVKFFLEPFLFLKSNEKPILNKFHKNGTFKRQEVIRYDYFLKKINFLPTKEFNGKSNFYLHHAGLKEGDMHFTEEGNTELATYLYENMESKENYENFLSLL